MKVIIDADACPVLKRAVRICEELKIPVSLVFDDSHIINDEYAETIQVDTGKNSVDITIISLTNSGDLIVTQDVELAQLCLEKNAKALDIAGEKYSPYTIDFRIMARDYNAKMRRTGRRYKNQSKRKNKDDRLFDKRFREMILEMMNENK